MMRMVLVMGSEGINLILGSFGKLFINMYIINVHIDNRKLIISLILGPYYTIGSI